MAGLAYQRSRRLHSAPTAGGPAGARGHSGVLFSVPDGGGAIGYQLSAVGWLRTMVSNRVKNLMSDRREVHAASLVFMRTAVAAGWTEELFD